MTLFKNSTVVIIAPHMDDEIIGCAGTIILNEKDIERLVIVHMTFDAHRETERQKVDKILHVSENYNLGLMDGFVNHYYDVGVNKLIEVIQKEQPNIVFIPHMYDNHVDHIATHNIAIDALEKARYWHTEYHLWKVQYVFEYEVWSFQRIVSEVVDITEVLEQKKNLMKLYESQTIDFNYLEYIHYINGYRGLLFNKIGFAECFMIRRI